MTIPGDEILTNWPLGRPNRPIDKSSEPWLEIAEKVLRGEFHKADVATIKSLKIGIRAVFTGRCQEAHKFLTKKKHETPDAVPDP